MRAWREHKGMKLNELARKAGVSPSYLSQIENGKRNPSVESIKAIAAALDIAPEILI